MSARSGGNAANGDPGNDMPAVMMALNAGYELTGKGGKRSVPARGYYRGAYDTALKPGEILTAIRIPVPPAGHGYAYEKLKRKVGDYATAAAAVVLDHGGRQGGHRAPSGSPTSPTRRSSPRRPRHSHRLVARRRHREARRRGGRGDHRAGQRPPRHAAIPHQDGGRDARRARWLAQNRAPPDRSKSWPRSRFRSRSTASRSTRWSSRARCSSTSCARSCASPARISGARPRHCGACTVDLDGKSVKACTIFAVAGERRRDQDHRRHGAADGSLHPAAGGVPRASRAAMRLLHAGHDHPRLPAAARRTPTRRRTRSAPASPAISAAAPATRTS